MYLGFAKIVSFKTNVVGTVIVAALASVLTTVTTQYLSSPNAPLPVAAAPAPLSTAAQSSILECGDGVYSPVQKICVTREVFEAEMQRLFAALGIDTSAYGLGTNTNN